MKQLPRTLIKPFCYSFLIILLITDCSSKKYGNPTEVCKAYIDGFNNNDLEGIRSLTFERKSEEDINKILAMWEKLSATAEIKSMSESNKTDSTVIINLVLQYSMTVEGKEVTEEENRVFSLRKENIQWKIEKGLL